MMGADLYKGWTITPPHWPLPWTATGPNYDASWEGEEDGWVATGGHAFAQTREQLIVEIDNCIEDEGH